MSIIYPLEEILGIKKRRVQEAERVVKRKEEALKQEEEELIRVKENAECFKVLFQEELCRVIVHGVLHFCGYKDKTKADIKLMRSKEDFYLNQLR